ncbi:GGDEF domain-containing protein [archaeon]|nr:GGDEF domain-containing protein [archaeon]
MEKKLSNLIEKLSTGKLTFKTVIKEVSSWDDPHKEVEAYFALIDSTCKDRDIETLSKMNKEAYNKVLILEDMDTLTRLPKRKTFEKIFKREYSRFERSGDPFSIVIIDLDYFKKVNDTYGHLAGDAVLEKFAKNIRTWIRKIDFACRYGGEEFALIYSSISGENAVGAIDNLIKRVSKSKINIGKGKKIKITFSAGVYEIKEKDSLNDAFERADKALYKAKENGRKQSALYKD